MRLCSSLGLSSAAGCGERLRLAVCACVFATLCTLVGALPAIVIAAQTAGADANADVARRIEQILPAMREFRRTAALDEQQAIARFASPAGARRFADMDRRIWGKADRKLGWTYFMSMAVTTLGAPGAERPLIAYYHPWSDVFLITAWRVESGRAVIDDAQFVPGDWVRNRGAPPFDVRPLWLRGQDYLPLAAGRAVARSVRAFEETFAGWAGTDWRSVIAGPGANGAARNLVEPMSAAMLNSTLAHAARLSVPSPGEPADRAALRASTARVLGMFEQGRVQQALAALPDTLPEARLALRRIAPATFADLLVAAGFAGTRAGNVCLASGSGGDYAICITFRRGAEGYEPQRADIVYYPTIYSAWVQQQAAVAGGSR